MGVKGAVFDSAGETTQHWIPGGYSRLDFVRAAGGTVSIANGVIMGKSIGGNPNIIQWFSNPSEAQDALVSGELLDAVRHAFKPGGGLVPQKVGAWRVNPGTQSSIDLLASAVDSVVVTSIMYGVLANRIRTKVEAGTTGKKITVTYGDISEVFDNVLKNSFLIRYTGLGSAAVMTIDPVAGTLSTTCTGASGDNLALNFVDFPTIEELVAYIDALTAYTCTVQTSNGNELTNKLDNVTAQDIRTGDYIVTSNLQSQIDAYNLSAYVTAAAKAGLATRASLSNVAYAYLSGAVSGSYGDTEWGVSLPLIKLEDVQLISTSSEASSVHAKIRDHCNECNAVTGKTERQFIVGGALSESVVQAIARAAVLNSNYGMLAYPGFTHYDFNDFTKTKSWSPAYYASKQFGMFICLGLPEPGTNKEVDVLAWEKKLSDTDLEALIQGGVSAGYTDRSGRKINVRTVNTYQGDELQKCEFSMMREALFVSRDMRTAVERTFVGKAMTNTMLGRVDAVVVGKLSQYSDMQLFVGAPEYWGYQKSVNGDTIKIDFHCNLTPPTNFIFITSHMHVYATVPKAA